MNPLVLYWNDLSFPDELIEGEFSQDGPWAVRAKHAFVALQRAFRCQQQARISVVKGEFHAVVQGKPLLSWLELWLGKDRVRRILGRAIQPINYPEGHGDTLICDVKVGERVGDGVTRAHLANSWVWSLGNEPTASHSHIIPANAYELNGNGDVVTEGVEIRNLASEAHAAHWEDAMAGWGKQWSRNCVIGIVSGHQVIMYPLDHGYPHIHVKSTNPPVQSYKFRIDKFGALTDSPVALTASIGTWVGEHANSLMESWRRCQKGMHPLSI